MLAAAVTASATHFCISCLVTRLFCLDVGVGCVCVIDFVFCVISFD